MKLKDQMAAKKAELAALKAKIEEGDEEAIKAGEALAGEIETLGSKIKQAEKAEKVLAMIGTDEKKEKEMGLNLNLEELKNTKGSKSFDLKAYNDNHTAPTVTVVDTKVVDAQPVLGVRDVFGAEAINGNALTFFRLGDMAGTIGVTNEGAKKPQVNIPNTPVTVALAKIAGFIKETDELLSDGSFLDSAIRGRLKYEFAKAVEGYLVSGLTGTSGIQAGEATISFDNILKAKQAVRNETGYAPDTLLINPADLESLLLSKDKNDQYLLGGPAYGAYGNGGYNSNPRIWGLTVVESSEVPEGVCVVGAFKAGASVVTKAGEGQRVEVSNSDQDDFVYNRVTVRIEERMVLAVRVPKAFVLVGTADSSSSSSSSSSST